MNGEEQAKPHPAFLGSAQRRPSITSSTELTRQGVSQLHINRSVPSSRNPPPPLTGPIVNRGSGMLNPGGVFSDNPGGALPPMRAVGPGSVGVMVTANGTLEGGPFGPAGRGALGVRKGVAKNEKNALKSRRHRARKKVGGNGRAGLLKCSEAAMWKGSKVDSHRPCAISPFEAAAWHKRRRRTSFEGKERLEQKLERSCGLAFVKLASQVPQR